MSSVFPRAARIWISNEHKLQPQRFASHGKWEAEPVLQAEPLCFPQGQLCQADTKKGEAEAEGEAQELWELHTLSSLWSCWAVLGASSVATCPQGTSSFPWWLFFPLLHSLPYTRDQFQLPEDTDLVSVIMPVSKQVKWAAFMPRWPCPPNDTTRAIIFRKSSRP